MLFSSHAHTHTQKKMMLIALVVFSALMLPNMDGFVEAKPFIAEDENLLSFLSSLSSAVTSSKDGDLNFYDASSMRNKGEDNSMNEEQRQIDLIETKSNQVCENIF